jgi:hypothetical protein
MHRLILLYLYTSSHYTSSQTRRGYLISIVARKTDLVKKFEEATKSTSNVLKKPFNGIYLVVW